MLPGFNEAPAISPGNAKNAHDWRYQVAELQ